jgi:hypothetical protein
MPNVLLLVLMELDQENWRPCPGAMRFTEVRCRPFSYVNFLTVSPHDGTREMVLGLPLVPSARIDIVGKLRVISK